MTTIRLRLLGLLRREEGQDLVEYTLLFTFIVVASIGALTLLGGPLAAIFTQAAAALP